MNFPSNRGSVTEALCLTCSSVEIHTLFLEGAAVESDMLLIKIHQLVPLPHMYIVHEHISFRNIRIMRIVRIMRIGKIKTIERELYLIFMTDWFSKASGEALLVTELFYLCTLPF